VGTESIKEGGDDVSLDLNASPAFALLLRHNKGLVVPAYSSIQIGISFAPEKLGVYRGQLQVRSTLASRSLMWCFPLVGVTEVGGVQRWPHMLCQCKSSSIQEVVIHLTGLLGSNITPNESLTAADFEIESIIEEPLRKCVSRAFRVQALDIVPVTNAGPQVAYGVRCRVLFEPLKEMNTRVEIIASSRVRGQWRSEVQLQATPPDPDDIIRLVATVGERDQVSFRLSNRFLGFSQFRATFDVASSPHFTCIPTTGVLAPYGAAGTNFTVTFSPMTYGTNEKATLMVTTDEAQWCYRLVGNYPSLQLSGSPSGRVDTR
jgi:hypothetical protein